VARIDLGAITRADAKLLLRAVRTEPRLEWFAKNLEEELAFEPIVAPWRRVVGRGRHNTHRPYDQLECGHTYTLRYTKNWMEDHGTKRRCLTCLREQQQQAGEPLTPPPIALGPR